MGRVWITWDPAYLHVTKISESDQFIHSKVTCLVTNSSFFYTAVYARNAFDRRQVLWGDLIQLKIHSQGPWCLMGDYNNVLYTDERVGCEPVHPKEIEYFMNCLNKIEVFDMQATGFSFSWSNNAEGSKRKCSRIDRTLINVEWCTAYPNTTSNFTPPLVSDHSAMIIQWHNATHPSFPFRFQNAWLHHPSFPDLLASVWQKRITGNPLQIILRKQKLLKSRLKEWSKSNCSDIHKEVQKVKEELIEVQEKLQDNTYDTQLAKQEKILREEYAI